MKKDAIILISREKLLLDLMLEKHMFFAIAVAKHMRQDQFGHAFIFKTAPISAVVYEAEIDAIKSISEDPVIYANITHILTSLGMSLLHVGGKRELCVVLFKDKAYEIEHIPRPKGSKESVRCRRYANADRVHNAHYFDAIF